MEQLMKLNSTHKIKRAFHQQQTLNSRLSRDGKIPTEVKSGLTRSVARTRLPGHGFVLFFHHGLVLVARE